MYFSFILFSAAGRPTLPLVGVPSIAMSVNFCTSVYMSVSVQTSRNFLDVLIAAVARSSADDNAMFHVLSVLRTTSCLPIIGQRRCQ